MSRATSAVLLAISLVLAFGCASPGGIARPEPRQLIPPETPKKLDRIIDSPAAYEAVYAEVSFPPRDDYETEEAFRSRLDPPSDKLRYFAMPGGKIIDNYFNYYSRVEYDVDRQLFVGHLSLDRKRFGGETAAATPYAKHSYLDISGDDGFEIMYLHCIEEVQSRSSYYGSNAYGATARVFRTSYDEYGLAVAWPQPMPYAARFQYEFSMSPDEARRLDDNLIMVVAARVLPTIGNLKDFYSSTPTISSPSASYRDYLAIPVEVDHILLVNKATREVIGIYDQDG